GRAGRTAPGVAIRLWTEALHRGLPQADRPEILEAELSGLALDCAAWGAEPGVLAFLDAPPGGTMAAARGLLRDLDALDEVGRITETGRRMARMGTHPRLARMMLAAEGNAEKALAAELAALLEERDPLRGREAPAEIGLRLDLLAGGDHAAADRGAAAHSPCRQPASAPAWHWQWCHRRWRCRRLAGSRLPGPDRGQARCDGWRLSFGLGPGGTHHRH
ncbi:MAG: hypothetical protein ACKO4X_15810, partial [Alphaproteobacteria bacterium]